MVNVRDLLLKSQKPNFVTIKAQAVQEHVEAVRASGISDDALVTAAYEEAYSQLERDGRLKALQGVLPLKVGEKVIKKAIGEFETFHAGGRGDGPTVSQRIVQWLQDHQDQSYTATEIADKIQYENHGSVAAALNVLRNQGVLDSSTGRPQKWFLKSAGNPELQSLLPSGTKMDYLG